jgi:hypothetical protein
MNKTYELLKIAKSNSEQLLNNNKKNLISDTVLIGVSALGGVVSVVTGNIFLLPVVIGGGAFGVMRLRNSIMRKADYNVQSSYIDSIISDIELLDEQGKVK